ncbi:MAG: hypothetical protein PHV42_01735 [Candidatus Pacebacteria bacterium]|nr:hypothetical protein [Candidatus Paceibacterota bacterium]
MHFLLPIIFILIAGFLFAKVEIEIEGPYGWAEKLPTWKLSKEHIVSKVFFGGRPATGYHIWAVSFLFFFIHIIYLFLPLSFAVELRLISLFILFWVVEDFFWFVFNPAFGLKNFRKDKIWWHKDNWWRIAPRDYFIFLPLGFFLYFASFFVG